MEIYRQTDIRWASKPLGVSPYFMGTPGVGFGCTTTCIAQILTIAGWNITPGDVNDGLNAIGGYTDRNYIPEATDGGSGLLLWYKAMQAFPQFHWNTGGPYELMVGDLGAYNHWSVQYQGALYDSITGSNTLYPRVHNWRVAYGCTVDAPIIVPVSVTIDFSITVSGPIGSANFRTEPKTGDNIAVNYSNGTVVDCNDTVTGQPMTITWPDGRVVTTDKWYKSSLHGYYISAAVSIHN